MTVKLGEYVLEKKIGKGGMGQVYLARQESLDRKVAIKVLPKELASDETFRLRFEREAKIAANLVHPNVIQIYSYGIEKGIPYFAMEFVDGEDIAQKLKKGEKFTVRQTISLVKDVAKALDAAHKRSMVHRDIKPSNIMIASDGSVKVMDFGLAKATTVNTAITQRGIIMGTPPYMSPEQGKGETLDVRSDMYSLGVVLYELLSGQVPFRAETPTAVIYQHIYEKPMSVRQINPEVSPQLESIVMKLLEKNVKDRLQTPSELIEALTAFETGAPTVLKTAPKTLELDTGSDKSMVQAEQQKSSKWLLLTGIAAVCILIVFAVLYVMREKERAANNKDTPDTTPSIVEKPPIDEHQKPPIPADKTYLLELSKLKSKVPAGAIVYLKGKGGIQPFEDTEMPLVNKNMPAGKYALTIKRSSGYEPVEIGIELSEAGTIPPLDTLAIEYKLRNDLNTAYQKGCNFLEQKKYSDALIELKIVENAAPDYGNIKKLIKECNDKLSELEQTDKVIEEHYTKGLSCFKNQEWQNAIDEFEDIPGNHKRAADAARLISEAKQKIEEKERSEKAKIAETIKSAKEAVAAKEYEVAQKILNQLLASYPTNEEAKDLLKKAEEGFTQRTKKQAKIDFEFNTANSCYNEGKGKEAEEHLLIILNELDPDNNKAKLLYAQVKELISKEKILETISKFDNAYEKGIVSEVLELIDPERGNLKKDLENQINSFSSASVKFNNAKHEELTVTLKDDVAVVKGTFKIELYYTELNIKNELEIRHTVKLVRRADVWYIESIEEESS
ncbi:MAG: protein kinase [Planctomycetota bacterium]